MGIGWIAIGIGLIVGAVMVWNGGKYAGIVEAYEERDSLMLDAIRHEAQRLEAAREALIRCRQADEMEACTR